MNLELSSVRWLAPAHDTLAPDGSEIRLLGHVAGGSMVHCTLPAGRVTHAVKHRTVEEIWHILSGHGQVWRKLGDAEAVVDVGPGASLTIHLGVAFQFRTIGDEPLAFVIVTMPPWPGEDEAVPVPGLWEPRSEIREI
ncbi:MAG TPA: cupin domain-containing protein [Thermomicrobiales bacterium]|nr:cupin domain-containing protein [Thermomicrobiales bacterium]